MDTYVKLDKVSKIYGSGDVKIKAADEISFQITKGEFVVIVGPSGAGKTTVLNILGGMDTATSGHVWVDGKDIAGYTGRQLTAYRREDIGFVFQFYNLVPNLTVLENIQVGEYLSDSPLEMGEILSVLGLYELQNRFPKELSGGQQQRCSIGRALIKNPKLLLCDEPTGALDYQTSKDILGLIERINQTYQTTILIVTHNQVIREMTHKTVYLRDGAVAKIEENHNRKSAGELEW